MSEPTFRYAHWVFCKDAEQVQKMVKDSRAFLCQFIVHHGEQPVWDNPNIGEQPRRIWFDSANWGYVSDALYALSSLDPRHPDPLPTEQVAALLEHAFELVFDWLGKWPKMRPNLCIPPRIAALEVRKESLSEGKPTT